MRHIDKIIIQHTSESRAASSCGSDIDRQELINNYGTEKYLSKWSFEGQDRIDTPDSINKITDDKKLSESKPCDKSLAIEDDNESLVSYNSVRDGDILSKNTATSYLPYQIQKPKQDMTLWQGYGGNIYFDPVQCRSLHINSSKPNKKKSKDKTTGMYRLTKSCSPAVETQTQNDSHGFSSRSASSFHSLGSLRISSKEEKKKHTPRTHFQNGRLCKGFNKEKELSRCKSSPESLGIAGGQVNAKTDPIDSVFKLNKVRLSSKSRESLNDYQNFSFRSNREWDNSCGDHSPRNASTGSRLLRVGQMTTSRKGSTAEATPVFIIPFATLDDPVEPEITLKQDKKDFINTDKVDAKVPEKVIPKTKTVSDVKVTEKPNEYKVKPLSGSTVTAHVVNITAEAKTKASLTTYRNPSFQLRREISSTSLSNYLRAVPSQYSRTFPVTKPKKSIPRLSYTQRTEEFIPSDMLLSRNDISSNNTNGFSRTRALYGGYLPSMGTDNHNFNAQISSETSDSDSITSPPREEDRQLTHGFSVKSCLKKPGVHPTAKEQSKNEKCHLPVIGWQVS